MQDSVIKRDEATPVEMFKGVVRRTLGTTNTMMVCEVVLDADAVVPMHQHIHEQTGYVVSGRVQFVIGDETYLLKAGDSYAIASNTLHEATALETSVLIDIFSPIREEYR